MLRRLLTLDPPTTWRPHLVQLLVIVLAWCAGTGLAGWLWGTG